MAEQEPSSLGDFRLGDWLVQPRLNRISRGDSTITLELKVMQVLVCLAGHGGDLVTRQELVDTVWATEFISDNTVTHAVTEIRNALGDDAKSPIYVETIHRRGYRLVAPVEWVSREDGEKVVQAPHSKPRWPHILAVGIAAVIGLLVILPPEALFERRGEVPTDEPLPRIVVLPFENLGPPEDEYFADGITEEIISRLAAVSGLQVISRTSAMHYKNRRVPVGQIGEELDVGYVLEGTIRWDRGGGGHGRVLINPQLIDVTDDAHLWSDRFDRVLEDIFTIQSDVAEQVISHLQAILLESERRFIEARPTDNLEAYQAYLLGTQYLNRSYEESDIRLGLEMLERAVELDPEFAVAHAVLSEAHSAFYHFRFDFNPERLARAEAAVERALELQPGLPEGHRALANYYYCGFRDHDRALEQFAAAAEGLPNDAGVLGGIFAVYRDQLRWDEALEALKKWLEVNPQDYVAALEARNTYVYLHDYEKAEIEIRRAIAIAPDRPGAYYCGAFDYVSWDGNTDRARNLLESAPSVESPWFNYMRIQLDWYDRKTESALAKLEEWPIDAFDWQQAYEPKRLLECIFLSGMGEEQRARAACATAAELLEREIEARPQDYRLHTSLGRAYARLGRKEEAVRAGENAIELVPVVADKWPQKIGLAEIYARVGQHDKAIDLIDELLSIPCEFSVGLLRLDPAWDPLRDNPRFQALLEKYDTKD
jgi:TolB-like protein/DNA-binding winged helix-turn-helix (wHTH) protein/Tfp pilus assembly protein PilF